MPAIERRIRSKIDEITFLCNDGSEGASRFSDILSAHVRQHIFIIVTILKYMPSDAKSSIAPSLLLEMCPQEDGLPERSGTRTMQTTLTGSYGNVDRQSV